MMRWCGIAVVASAALWATAGQALAQTCAAGAPVAFIEADVLTMTSETLIRGQTVLVDGGVIRAIGSPELPADVCRIDARGKVVLPGLADLHVHTNEREMPLFLANGVTLVREMNGSPAHLQLRAGLERGERTGPRLVVASSLLSGQELRYRHRLILTADDAYAAAHDAAESGYAYLKIYDDLTLDQYEAFVEAGRNLGLPLDGHVPAAVGLERVLDAGQAIQHMDKIAFTLGGHSGGPAALVEARRLFAGRSAWVTPTLASLRALDLTGTSEYSVSLSRPEMAYVDSASAAWWRSLAGSATRPAARSPFYRFQLELLSVLKETGTRFLLGTDAANPLMVAGFSVHDELEALVVDGGLSPYEALWVATRNAADFLGEPLNGRVQVGARADLLLVESDPLSDLSVLRRPLGVVIGGRWIERSELEASLMQARVSNPDQ